MKHLTATVLLALALCGPAFAETAVDVIGDYTFPNTIEGMPVMTQRNLLRLSC